MNYPSHDPKRPSFDGLSAAFVRMPAVVRLTGLGRSTIYRLIAQDMFPSPVRLSKRAIAWRRADLEEWSGARQKVPH